MQTREELYDVLDYHAYEAAARSSFLARSAMREANMSDPRRELRVKKSVALSGCAGRLHRAVHASARPATICTIAAMTFWISRTSLPIRGDRLPLIHGDLPNRADLGAYKTKLDSLRGLPRTVRAALEVLPPPRIPMDVLRTGVSAIGCALPESARTWRRRRARNRRPADRLARLDADLLVSLQPQRQPHPRRDRR